MDWSLFWSAFAAFAQIGAAGVTVWAVIVALRLGKKEEKRSLQSRYDSARPILLIETYQIGISIQANHV